MGLLGLSVDTATAAGLTGPLKAAYVYHDTGHAERLKDSTHSLSFYC